MLPEEDRIEGRVDTEEEKSYISSLLQSIINQGKSFQELEDANVMFNLDPYYKDTGRFASDIRVGTTFQLQLLDKTTGEAIDNREIEFFYCKENEKILNGDGSYYYGRKIFLPFETKVENGDFYALLEEDGRITGIKETESIAGTNQTKVFQILMKFRDHYYLRDISVKPQGTVLAYEKYDQIEEEEENKIVAMFENLSDLEKVVGVHDYLIRNVNYGRSPENLFRAQSKIGAFLDKKAVCQGYSLAFSSLMNKLNVNNRTVYGNTIDTKHAWNMVQLDGEWYHLDVTFDYGTVHGRDVPEWMRYKYFLLDDKEISNSRTDFSWRDGEGKKYRHQIFADIKADNQEEIEKVAGKQFKANAGQQMFLTVFANGELGIQRIKDSLIKFVRERGGNIIQYGPEPKVDTEDPVQNQDSALTGKNTKISYKMPDYVLYYVKAEFPVISGEKKELNFLSLVEDEPKNMARKKLKLSFDKEFAPGEELTVLDLKVAGGKKKKLTRSMSDPKVYELELEVNSADSHTVSVTVTKRGYEILNSTQSCQISGIVRHEFPNAYFEANSENSGYLCGITEGMKYRVGTGNWVLAEKNQEKVFLSSVAADTKILVVREKTKDREASETQTIKIKKRKPPYGVSALSIKNAGTGGLKGITVDMEYKKSEANSWISVNENGKILNLEAGKYLIRYKAKRNELPSEAKEVKIKKQNSAGESNSGGGSSQSGGGSSATSSSVSDVQKKEDLHKSSSEIEIRKGEEKHSLIASTTLVPVSTKESGKAVLSDKIIKSMLQQARKEVKKEETALHFEIHIPKGDKKVEESLVLSQKALNLLTKAEVKDVNLHIDDIRLSFNQKSLNAIKDKSEGEVDITVKRVKTSQLTDKFKKVIQDKPVYEFQVKYGEDKKISSFGEGQVKIVFPYELKDEENAEYLIAYYIDKKQGIRPVSNSYYNEEKQELSFLTSHFSLYTIGYRNVKTFSDIKKHPQKESLSFVSARGLLQANGKGELRPDDKMNENDFIKALGRIASNRNWDEKNSDKALLKWAKKNNMLKELKWKTGDVPLTRKEAVILVEHFIRNMGPDFHKNKDLTELSALIVKEKNSSKSVMSRAEAAVLLESLIKRIFL